MKPRLKKMLTIAPFAISGMVLFIFMGSEIVRQLWNWLAPTLFGLQTITFWQALGLLGLCRILFGGLGFNGRGRDWRRHRDGRWDCMTPEERERFREGMRERGGFGPAASESEVG